MRDWRAYVNERLSSAPISQRDHVVDELAAHLEECYLALCAQGLSDEDACAWTCAKAGDWDHLRKEVTLAKREGTMNDRVKQIWIPSVTTLFVGWAALGLIIWSGIQPLTGDWWHTGQTGAILYVHWPWLMILPFVGAVGAYMSRRAEGSGWRVYVSGAFPVLGTAVVFAVTFPFAFLVDVRVVPFFKVTSLLAGMISWVVLPGIALCIGIALEGLRRQSHTQIRT
jgi:hypothetical protein